MTAPHYPFLDLATVNRPYAAEITEAVTRVANSGRYIGGPEVELFEQELASFAGSRYAVGVSNGLDALRLIFRAYIELGIMSPGDEVIVPANTYIASVLAVTDNALVPVFAEPDPRTMNLDTSRLDEYLTPRTRAVMPVHLYGRTCFDSKLVDFAQANNLKIVEDNAQAIGATATIPGLGGSNMTGALGHAGAFSFYPTKNVGAIGDAGAVTTDDEDLASAIAALRNYGSDRQYHNIYAGLNCRLDPIQAAVVALKLPYTDHENSLRRDVARVYETKISNPAIIKPLFSDDSTSVWHQYVVQVNDRDNFRSYLANAGVETAIHYPASPFDQPCYVGKYGYIDRPIARRLAQTVVSLPVSRCTSESDALEIADIINSYNPISK